MTTTSGPAHVASLGQVMFTSRKGPIQTLERTQSDPVFGTVSAQHPRVFCGPVGMVQHGALRGAASKGRQTSPASPGNHGLLGSPSMIP